MTLSGFIENQNGIYKQIQDQGNKVFSEGIKPDKAVVEEHGGLLISFRHPIEMMEKLEEFSSKIAEVTPAVPFGVSNAHTTISDYNVAPNYRVDWENKETDLLCKNLIKAITTALGKIESNSLKINFTGFIYNQTTVIATGTPNEAVLNLVQAIRNSAEEMGITLRMPWGMHITTNRFTEAKSQGELSEFFILMKNIPHLGLSYPVAIDLSYFYIANNKEVLHLIQRFKL